MIQGLSTKIQEWLGAREPSQGGSVADILTQRLQPNTDDVSQAIQASYFGKQPVFAQQVADQRQLAEDDRLTKSLSKLEALSKLQSMQQSQAMNQKIMERLTGGPKMSGATNVPSNAPLSVRNNNRGNLKDPRTGGFRQFATPEEGDMANLNDLKLKISGNSPVMQQKFGKDYVPNIENIITAWAPPSENDTQNYINFVSSKLGIDPKQPLDKSQAEILLWAMGLMEGGEESSDYFGGTQYAQNTTQMNDGMDELTQMQVMSALAAGDTQEALKIMAEAKKGPEPSTDIGKMQRDEQQGLVPRGSTESLVKQKNRQIRKEELEAQQAEQASLKASEQEKVTQEVANKKIKEAATLLSKNINSGGMAATASLNLIPGKSTGADQLQSVYSTLKSVISLDKLMEMKKASPTGASGFGALSAPELALLTDSVTALDVELPRHVQLENLKTIADILGFELPKELVSGGGIKFLGFESK